MYFFKEILEVRKYFKASKSYHEITFYSESGIYFQNFQGTIGSILEKSDFTILYITSDAKDPILSRENDRIKVFYINKLIPLVFPFIKTKTLVMTMADLNQFHVKRSTNRVNHIYMFHAINSIHLQYNLGAFDHYDTIFCVGPHHMKEIRKTEEIYNLPAKELVEVGYSWLEDIEAKYAQSISKGQKILIAPSWSDGNILETCLETILDKILLLPYEVVVRPHPEFIKRQNNRIKEIREKYKNHHNFYLETDSSSSQNIEESSLLITDWSGIAIEFAWGMLKPVIYINTPKKVHNVEYKKIDIIPLEDKIRSLNGTVLETSDCMNIDLKIEKVLENTEKNKDSLKKLRQDNIFNWGKSSDVGADYIIKYCNDNQMI